VNAETIRKLIRTRHSKDLIVEECLMGPMASARYDAWVMRKSWSPKCTIGYEIKVSRSDFLRDDKWTQYLAGCNEFYFAVAPGIVSIEEVPAQCGLLVASKNGARLYTKKKAPRREPEPGPLHDVMTHVLMSRAEILSPKERARFGEGRNSKDKAERVAYWRRWTAEKKEAWQVGLDVSSRIVRTARGAEERAAEIEGRLKKWGDFADKLRAHGIDPDASRWELSRAADRIANVVDARKLSDIRRASETLSEIADELDKLGDSKN
jgi:hypothetical protein